MNEEKKKEDFKELKTKDQFILLTLCAIVLVIFVLVMALAVYQVTRFGLSWQQAYMGITLVVGTLMGTAMHGKELKCNGFMSLIRGLFVAYVLYSAGFFNV